MVPIFGREAELARLDGLLDAAPGAHGAALLVLGEPGVGKSALVDAVAARAGGFQVVSTTGVDSESDIPFGALAQLLAPVLGFVDQLPAVQAAALTAALRISPGVQVERLACFAGAMNLLAAAAARQPVLLVVDDLQWVDAASRAAILFAARRLTSDPVVVLLIARQGDGGLPGTTGIAELRLAGLDEQASSELLQSAHPRIGREVGARLWRQTGGNPLALLEIPRQLSAAQITGHEPIDDPLPVGKLIEAAFAREADALPAATRRALLIAAASYTGAADAVAAAIATSGLPSGALDSAEAVGLLSFGAGELRWRHPLVRSAIYHRGSPAARRDAHRVLAQGGAESALAEHRAWHLAAACTAPDEEVAALLEQVAAEAARRGALATASHALAAAAALTPAEATRAQRALGAAEHAVAVGHWEEADTLLAGARAFSGEPLQRAQCERIQARMDLLRGAPLAAHRRLLTTAETIGGSDPALAAMLLTETIVALGVAGELREYRETAVYAFELGQQVGGVVEAVAGLVVAAGLVVHGEAAEALGLYEQYRAAAADPVLWRAAPEIPGMYAYCQMTIERFAESERLLSAMVASGRSNGAVRTLAYPLAESAQLYLRLGRWPAALAAAQESVALSRDMLEGAVLAYALAVLARVQAVRGEREAAKAAASESIQLAGTLAARGVEAHAHAALGLLALGACDWQAAVRRFERIDPALAEQIHEPGWLQIDDGLIEARIHAGRLREAEDKLAELQRWSHATGRSWGQAVCARCRGLLVGDAEIDEQFGAALKWHRRAPLPFDRARTELAYGERLRRARRRADARDQLAGAAATFHALGAADWAARAERELAAAGYASPRQNGSPWSLLTAAETQVVQVILGGATYQEAAATLFVSPRTIDSHLRQVYKKLGVRSRTQLAHALDGDISGISPMRKASQGS